MVERPRRRFDAWGARLFRKLPEVLGALDVVAESFDLFAEDGRSDSTIIKDSMKIQLFLVGIEVESSGFNIAIGDEQAFPLGCGNGVGRFHEPGISIQTKLGFVIT
jgi:hypothetical protein